MLLYLSEYIIPHSRTIHVRTVNRIKRLSEINETAHHAPLKDSREDDRTACKTKMASVVLYSDLLAN